MPHLPQYTTLASQVFGQYLDNEIDLQTLIGRLQEMELQIMSDEDEEEEESGKRVWFRFFDGDDMKTTISNLETELSNPVHPNSNILKRGIAFGLTNNELQVYYA